MTRYRLFIAYEGTAYHGWQVQAHSQSIQGEIEKALSIFFHQPIRIIGAGRTDTGVHARGQCAHFSTDMVFEPRRLLHALARLLPSDIRVYQVEAVDKNFHALYSAKRKIYAYHVWQEAIIDPFCRRTVTHFTYPLNMQKIDEALEYLQGTHDFAAFANQGTPVHCTIRTLFRVERKPAPGGFLIEFEGDGFLYKMVRNMMGLLLDIGRGKLEPTSIPALFESKDRKLGSFAAPASGLCLMQVIYH
jgi:tRNA pseudouridine38-40 synthase